MSPPRDTRTLDLLAWAPPEPVAAFAPEAVRAASLRAKVSRAVAACLREAREGGLDRDRIAEAMAEYLGEPVPKSALDVYASEAREEHSISVVRLLALVHATGDRRLLQLLAEPFGLAVIDARYVPAIEDAVVSDKIEELERRQALARRRWKGGVR